jgi:hypothetical protein
LCNYFTCSYWICNPQYNYTFAISNVHGRGRKCAELQRVCKQILSLQPDTREIFGIMLRSLNANKLSLFVRLHRGIYCNNIANQWYFRWSLNSNLSLTIWLCFVDLYLTVASHGIARFKSKVTTLYWYLITQQIKLICFVKRQDLPSFKWRAPRYCVCSQIVYHHIREIMLRD